ncbi:hypothetical protein [Gandjariella thermophila]|uniref:Uncharacterized protein n=1 Tax=Gandjariella thermophila TaxID=1931992 RepID=A0A4D4J658_9PSEU|nr:hypothetical protein [Gandjariella thermophila]GDY30069.1 hypothetical protein GTS_17020 [Gandjariella thermophila]
MARNTAFPRHVLCLDANFASTCTTAVDLTPGRNGIVLRLACLAAYTVTLDFDATGMLMDTLRTGDIRAVLAQHDQRGRVLLGIPPAPAARRARSRGAGADGAGTAPFAPAQRAAGVQPVPDRRIARPPGGRACRTDRTPTASEALT